MIRSVTNYFYFDPLAAVLTTLIIFLGITIASFAMRYMKGDFRYRHFFIYLTLLIGSVTVMVAADHLALLFTAWCASNFFLVNLMIHEPNWRAARNSGGVAAKNYLLGAGFIGVAFILLAAVFDETSIQSIITRSSESPLATLALLFLLIGAMTQSAIWPFHRWLISSLNSPTPISAIMHAGLINGGFLLLARFAPLYFGAPSILTLTFILGMGTALLGTLWKLMQTDIKRMLACSTMGQMGFMIVQCGIGLFPAALTHLVTHGMFKAYLFLASGGAPHEKRFDQTYRLKTSDCVYAPMCGIVASFCFAYSSGKSWFAGDASLVLMVVVLLASIQFALPILNLKTRIRPLFAFAATSFVAFIYGFIVYLFGVILEPMNLAQTQPLNLFHYLAIVLMIAVWTVTLIFKNGSGIPVPNQWLQRGYVKALNASQPDPETVTTHRSQYKYL